MLTSCMPKAMVIETFPTTAETKSTIREYLRGNLRDPYSIRDAAISNSWRTDVFFGRVGNRHIFVCARFNSKNRFGAYAGRSDVAYLIVDGKILDQEYESPACAEPTRVKTWMPFPEIMNIT